MDADLQILSPAPCVTHGDSGDDVTAPKGEPGAEPEPVSVQASVPPGGGAKTTPDATGAPRPTPGQPPAAKPKRKGGRKPLYATSEERKQRNRQAQAAFRERRTEYIKQLEATIKQNEEVLQTLHQNHRTAADECMMLRYKNSLLERILLEKGIDVQAELAMQNFSRQRFGTAATAAPPMAQQPALAYTAEPTHIMGGHRKIAMAPAPKPGHQYHRSHDGYVVHSPQLQPTPPSRLSSPGMCAETSAFGGVQPPAMPAVPASGLDLPPHGGQYQYSQQPACLATPRSHAHANVNAHAHAHAHSHTHSLSHARAPSMPQHQHQHQHHNQSTGYRELQAQHHHVPLAMSPSAGTMLADYDAVQQTVMPSPASTTDQSRFSNSGVGVGAGMGIGVGMSVGGGGGGGVAHAHHALPPLHKQYANLGPVD